MEAGSRTEADTTVVGCEVDDEVDGMRAEEAPDRFPVQQVGLNEPDPFRHGLAVAGAEVVQADDLMACAKQLLGHDAADVAGDAGYQRLQRGFPAGRFSATTPP